RSPGAGRTTGPVNGSRLRWGSRPSPRPDLPADQRPGGPPRRAAGNPPEVPTRGRDEILRFLEAIDGELVEHAREGETIDFYLIGRSALIVRYEVQLATKDVDIVHFHGAELERIAVERFGRGTPNAERLGFYLEPVPQGLPPIPGGYCHRS